MVSKGMTSATLTVVSLLQLWNPLRPLVLPVSVTFQAPLIVSGRWATSLLPSWIVRHRLGCLSDPQNPTQPPPLCCPCPAPVLGAYSGLPPPGLWPVPSPSDPALKRRPVVPPRPWDAVRGSYISIQAQLHCLFPSSFFCLDWKLLTSLPGQQTPHPASTTPDLHLDGSFGTQKANILLCGPFMMLYLQLCWVSLSFPI